MSSSARFSPAMARDPEALVPEALERANTYLEAGVDCVYPIVLCERDALRTSCRGSAAR